MELTKQQCKPCEGEEDRLSDRKAEKLQKEVPEWRRDDDRISRTFQFKDFKATMGFVNMVAALAEAEGHHPDMMVTYGEVQMTLWTHAVGGLSENDFILAAKIDRLV